MENLLDKYGKEKIYVIGLAIGIIISLITWLYISHNRASFEWQGEKFKLVREGISEAQVKDYKGNLMNIKIKQGNWDKYTQLITIEYLDQVIIYDSLNLFDKGIVISTPKGIVYEDKNTFGVTMANSQQEEKYLPLEADLAYKVAAVINDDLSIGVIILFFILQVVVFAVGLMNIICPEVGWQLKHFLSVEGGEPSDFYLIMSKLGGWVTVGFACIYPFIIINQV